MQCPASSCPVTVFCVGVDHYKDLIARLGFKAAQRIITRLIMQVTQELGSRAYIAQVGEDQVVLVMTDLESPDAAAVRADKLVQALYYFFENDVQDIILSLSIGISLFPNDTDSVECLLQNAMFAMTCVTPAKSCRYQFYNAWTNAKARKLNKMEVDFYQALEEKQFHLVYQPQIDYRSGHIVGAEALLRWRHPEQGLISPDTFIPIAEKNLEIITLGLWVIESACKDLSRWHKKGYKDSRVSVNLSAIQFRDQELPEKIRGLLKQYHIPPQSLELEVTETFIMENSEVAAVYLQRLKAIGVTLALDDFGTGYSSLSYLQKFPFDKLKIDKSFVDGLPHNPINAAITESIIQLSKRLNLTVLAEGVEQPVQERFLLQLGCNEGQGYLYGKPMTVKAFIALLSQQAQSD